MVRALPVESACLISLVDFFTSVIFLRSGVAVPWLACRYPSSFCLSASLSESVAADFATPALRSCSSRVSVDFLSSLANSATVVLDMCCGAFHHITRERRWRW